MFSELILDQILGMKWLKELIGTMLSALGMDITGRFGGTIQFFVFDVIKIVVLSFMMAVTTLSLPSIIMLKKAIKNKLLGVFIVTCTVGIIIVGYFFNAIQFMII